MSVSRDFVEHVLDLLSGWGNVSCRRMFGGYGLYRDGVHFALIAEDRLYLKADERSRPDFEAAGTQPFTYSARSRAVTLSYWEAPPELFDDAEAMVRWASRALEAALAKAKTKSSAPKSKARKAKKPPRRITKN
jgi:DNA transformation protein and related proteins